MNRPLGVLLVITLVSLLNGCQKVQVDYASTPDPGTGPAYTVGANVHTPVQTR